MEIYSFGGPSNPAGASAGANPENGAGAPAVKNVRQIWAEMENNMRAMRKAKVRPH